MSDFKLADPEEARNFRVGRSFIGLGDGQLYARDTLEGCLAELFWWISWVANGCQHHVVAEVDYEHGIVTLTAGRGLF